jgi:hypothetical protein
LPIERVRLRSGVQLPLPRAPRDGRRDRHAGVLEEGSDLFMTGSGHEVKGGRLRTADADGLDVERRQSEETVTPIDTEAVGVSASLPLSSTRCPRGLTRVTVATTPRKRVVNRDYL